MMMASNFRVEHPHVGVCMFHIQHEWSPGRSPFLGGPHKQSLRTSSKGRNVSKFPVPSITQSQDALAQESSRANHPVRPPACTCPEPQCLKVFKSGSLPMPTLTPPTPLTLPPPARRRRRWKKRKERVYSHKPHSKFEGSYDLKRSVCGSSAFSKIHKNLPKQPGLNC